MNQTQHVIDRLTGAVLVLGAIVDDEINCPGNDRQSTIRSTLTDLLREARKAAEQDSSDKLNHDASSSESGHTDRQNHDTSSGDTDSTVNPDKGCPSKPDKEYHCTGGYVDPEDILRMLYRDVANLNDLLNPSNSRTDPPASPSGKR